MYHNVHSAFTTLCWNFEPLNISFQCRCRTCGAIMMPVKTMGLVRWAGRLVRMRIAVFHRHLGADTDPRLWIKLTASRFHLSHRVLAIAAVLFSCFASAFLILLASVKSKTYERKLRFLVYYEKFQSKDSNFKCKLGCSYRFLLSPASVNNGAQYYMYLCNFSTDMIFPTLSPLLIVTGIPVTAMKLLWRQWSTLTIRYRPTC